MEEKGSMGMTSTRGRHKEGTEPVKLKFDRRDDQARGGIWKMKTHLTGRWEKMKNQAAKKILFFHAYQDIIDPKKEERIGSSRLEEKRRPWLQKEK